MKIIESGMIRQSSSGPNDDARFGTGVYLTKLDPTQTTRSRIIRNNWDGRRSTLPTKNWNKVQTVVRVLLKASKVSKCSSKRDVWLYKEDLYFNSSDVREWAVYLIEEDGQVEEYVPQ